MRLTTFQITIHLVSREMRLPASSVAPCDVERECLAPHWGHCLALSNDRMSSSRPPPSDSNGIHTLPLLSSQRRITEPP